MARRRQRYPSNSQSVKGADTVGRDTRGYDAEKKINGRKRFFATDTLGLLNAVAVRSVGVQDPGYHATCQRKYVIPATS